MLMSLQKSSTLLLHVQLDLHTPKANLFMSSSSHSEEEEGEEEDQLQWDRWRKKQQKIASEMHNLGRKIIEKYSKLLLSVITCSRTCKIFIEKYGKLLLSVITCSRTCKICMEDVCICGMFTIDGCWHQYCYTCMKRYIEFKISNEPNVPQCPHVNCGTKLNKIGRYKSFLSFKAVKLLEERILEDLVRVSDRIYCPYEDCSRLMKKGGGPFNLLKNKKRSCKTCRRHFCIKCRVPWHHGMSCDAYRRQNPETDNDVKFKVLAIEKSWRQCPNCKLMIQQSWGCRFILCRCDCMFCYTCGLADGDVRCSCKG